MPPSMQLAHSQGAGNGPPLGRLLDDLDRRSAHMAIHVRAVRFGEGVAKWPADRPLGSIEARARFDGAAFIVESATTDHARGAVVAETLAFDGRRTYSRGNHSPGWLLVSRSAPMPANLEHLGFADQSGRSLIDGMAGGESLVDLLGAAAEIDRAMVDGATRVTFVRRDGDGAPMPHERFELVVERAPRSAEDGDPDDPTGTARFSEFVETSFSGEPSDSAIETQRRVRRAVRWGDFDGVWLPAESEHRLEQRQPNGRLMSTRVEVSVIEARRVDPDEVRAAIASFAAPRPGETVFETDLRLQFRIGETRFTLAGAHYEAEAPLLEIPDGGAAQLIAGARRLDGGAETPGWGGALEGPVPGDTIRWLQLAIGAAFVGLGVVIWRRG